MASLGVSDRFGEGGLAVAASPLKTSLMIRVDWYDQIPPMFRMYKLRAPRVLANAATTQGHGATGASRSAIFLRYFSIAWR